MKGIVWFGKKGKLNPWYVRLFEVIEMVDPMAYIIALSPDLAGVHNAFHVFTL
jgi:hypothetical protein